MARYDDFSFLETISIEIGPLCNLKEIHKICPINYRKTIKYEMTIDQVVEIMDQAIRLNFRGFFAFHFYNEPLLYADRIAKLKKIRPTYKFLLWTNGVLINRLVKDGYNFGIFEKIVITRYRGVDNSGSLKLQDIHEDVRILDEDMDDRVHFYESKKENFISCKKVYVELPIDCEGNVYVCTYDWDQRYLLGNVLEQSLSDILRSKIYQKLLRGNEKRFRHIDDVIDLCKFCPRPYIIRK